MQLFHTTNIQDNLASLNEIEARHCVQVLRKKVGDQLDLVDGKGAFYKGEIIETGKGVDEIIPLLCARSERKRIREDRLEKILLSAMKQSLKANLPKLRSLIKFNDFIKEEHTVDQKLIAYCNDDQLKHLKVNYKKGNSSLILIGPEGDFNEAEIELAKANGFTGISLGKSRLRTETAGVVACTVFNLMNEDD